MARISVIGNVGQDPEYKTTGAGVEFISFSVADNNGGEEPVWYRVTQFNPNRRMTDSIKKGSLLDVAGLYKPREFKDKNGDNRTSHDITAYERAGINFAGGKAKDAPGASAPAANDDDLPF